MRIDSLNLLRYGHFANREISFPPAKPDFYVIYGDNEAGKSTLLRGISALFFGVPVRTPDVHSCKGPELRIEGTISDGARQFSFRRRKGTIGTLLNPDETQIQDNALAPFLRELDRERFEQFFGLDHERLRAGGEELLRGKGDVGSALFQAAGLLDLTKILERLDSDARELFSAKSKAKIIGLAIDEYKQARAEVKRLAISASEVKEKEAQLQSAKQKLDELREQSHALQQELVKLRRIAGNKPDIANLQKLRAALLGLESVPALPPNARRQRDEAVAALADATRQMERLSEQIAEHKRDIEALPAGALYKAHGVEIDELNAKIHDYVRGISDRPKRQSEREEAMRRAEEEWEQVDAWRKRPVADAEGLRRAYAQKSEIRDLITEHARLTTVLGDAEERLRQGKDDAERLANELALRPESPDPATLIASIEQAKSLGDVEQAMAKLRADAQKLLRDAERDLKNLAFAPSSIQELEELKTPLLATVHQYSQEWELLEDRRRELANREAQLEEIIRRKQAELQGSREKIGEASESELLESRSRRDQLWELIRASVFAKTITAADARKNSGSSEPLPDAFTQQLRRCDEIADSRFSNAGAVAIHDRVVKETNSARAEQQALVEDNAKLASGEAELRRRWTKQWENLGCDPLSPAEMKEWMQLRQLVLDKVEQAREKENDLRTLEQRVSAAAGEIRRRMKDLGSGAAGGDEPLSILIKVAEAFAREIQGQRSVVHDLRREAQALDLAKRQTKLDECKTKLSAWSANWTPRAGELLLPAISTSQQVGEALDVLERVFGHLTKANDLQYRVKRIGDNISEFEGMVSRLVAVLDPALASLAPELAAAELHSRYVEIGKAETKRGALEAQNLTDETTLSECRAKAAIASATLANLKQLGQCNDEQQLEAMINAAEERNEKQEEYRRLAQSLIERNAVPNLEQIEQEAAGFDLDSLRATIASGDERQQSLQGDVVDAGVEHSRLGDALAKLQNSEESVLQAQKAEDALAKVRPAVEQYLRLRLASEILQRAVESYREKHQGQVLQRASELFSRLTLGDHYGLTTAFGDDDKPVLVAIRNDKEQVEVGGLSDGTRDQLYLALRLAAIEDHVTRVAPCPLVLDDILINSDDSRAAAALQVIAELAKCVQVLLFTHHRRLAELGIRSGATVIDLGSLAASAAGAA